MRFLLMVLLSLSALSSSAFAEFRGTLLSYDQLISLTPQKRIKYIAEYRKLLIMMEKQEIKYKIGSYKSPAEEYSEKVANVMRIFEIVPQAEAEDAGEGVVAAPKLQTNPIVPVWDAKTGSGNCSSYNSGQTRYKFDEEVGTCVLMTQPGFINSLTGNQSGFSKGTCPKGTVEVPSPRGSMNVACVPQSSFNALDSERQAAVKNGEFYPKGTYGKFATEDSFRANSLRGLPSPKADAEKTAAAVPAADAAPQSPANAKVDEPKGGVDPLCQKSPDLNCTAITDKKDKAVEAFRTNKSEESNSCIIGGFFSKYKVATPRKPEGKCEPIRQFPPPPSPAAQTCKEAGTTMCNPMLFCVDGRKADLTGKIEPHYKCVALKDRKSGTDVTQRCDNWQKEAEKDPKFKPCDFKQSVAFQDVWIPTPEEKAKANGGPVVVDANPNRPPDFNYEKAWNEQKALLQKEFKRRCSDKTFEGASEPGFEGGFQGLFCNECKIMAAHLYKMNKDTVGYGCASKADATPVGAAPAATAPVAAPGLGKDTSSK
ncbi:MAG: hypothetical protein ACXVA9_09300 [Bdellovibrionales bacterium]